MKHQIWLIWGKISAILAIILSLVTVYNFLTTEKAKIKISIQNYEYEEKYDINELLYKNKQITNYENIYEIINIINDGSISKDNMEYLSKRLSGVLRSTWYIKEISPFYSDDELKYIYIIKIKNSGKISAKEFKLMNIAYGIYKLKLSNSSQVIGRFNRYIDIGEIRPNEEIVLYVWSFLDSNYLNHILYTHSKGSGIVDINKTDYITKYIQLSLLFLGILIIIIYYKNNKLP